MECSICYSIHDPQIHQATLRIRKQLRQFVQQSIQPLQLHKPTPRTKAFTNQPVIAFNTRNSGVRGQRAML